MAIIQKSDMEMVKDTLPVQLCGGLDLPLDMLASSGDRLQTSIAMLQKGNIVMSRSLVMHDPAERAIAVQEATKQREEAEVVLCQRTWQHSAHLASAAVEAEKLRQQLAAADAAHFELEAQCANLQDLKDATGVLRCGWCG